jgi:hypothetical protein
MHKIRLRGPWQLAKFKHGIEVSRKFHSPPGLAKESDFDATRSGAKVFFVVSSNAAIPLSWWRLNESVEHCKEENFDQTTTFSSQGTMLTNRRFELTGILLPFNQITFAWSALPESWQPVEGPYTPGHDHFLHFDSWIEIIE